MVGLSFGVAMGICSACGVIYGPVHSILPFLMLGKAISYLASYASLLDVRDFFPNKK